MFKFRLRYLLYTFVFILGLFCFPKNTYASCSKIAEYDICDSVDLSSCDQGDIGDGTWYVNDTYVKGRCENDGYLSHNVTWHCTTQEEAENKCDGTGGGNNLKACNINATGPIGTITASSSIIDYWSDGYELSGCPANDREFDKQLHWGLCGTMTQISSRDGTDAFPVSGHTDITIPTPGYNYIYGQYCYQAFAQGSCAGNPLSSCETGVNTYTYCPGSLPIGTFTLSQTYNAGTLANPNVITIPNGGVRISESPNQTSLNWSLSSFGANNTCSNTNSYSMYATQVNPSSSCPATVTSMPQIATINATNANDLTGSFVVRDLIGPIKYCWGIRATNGGNGANATVTSSVYSFVLRPPKTCNIIDMRVTRGTSTTTTPSSNSPFQYELGVNAVNITVSGLGTVETDKMRLWLEKSDGSVISQSFNPTKTSGIHNYYQMSPITLEEVGSDLIAGYSPLLPTTQIPAGNYYLHCDVTNDEETSGCSGNPFCSEEGLNGPYTCKPPWSSCSTTYDKMPLNVIYPGASMYGVVWIDADRSGGCFTNNKDIKVSSLNPPINPNVRIDNPLTSPITTDTLWNPTNSTYSLQVPYDAISPRLITINADPLPGYSGPEGRLISSNSSGVCNTISRNINGYTSATPSMDLVYTPVSDWMNASDGDVFVENSIANPIPSGTLPVGYTNNNWMITSITPAAPVGGIVMSGGAISTNRDGSTNRSSIRSVNTNTPNDGTPPGWEIANYQSDLSLFLDNLPDPNTYSTEVNINFKQDLSPTSAYFKNGPLNINSSNADDYNVEPNGVAIVLVDGNVTIGKDLKPADTINNTDGLIIIASGDITIGENVQQIRAVLISRGITDENGVITGGGNIVIEGNNSIDSQLVITGGIYARSGISSQRFLSPIAAINNSNSPAVSVVFNPLYLTVNNSTLSKRIYSWRELPTEAN